ncbi:MAG TPA: YceH family protein [Gaiellaceae bacterium]|nr:YceH family protein [Gaiellaceae bacterium]
MDADEVELRVLGCLIEKQRTTPDVYPLSLNALRLACNQTTNRDPVVDYDEPTIRASLERLGRKGWTRLASGPGSRAVKYRHLLEETLSLTPSQLSVLAVLLLRGPQTPGELKARTERLYPFGSLEDVHAALGQLAERGLAGRLPRRPGQKEERYRQLLGGGDGDEEPAAEQVAQSHKPSLLDDERAEMAALEARLARVEAKLDELMRALEPGPPGPGEGS